LVLAVRPVGNAPPVVNCTGVPVAMPVVEGTVKVAVAMLMVTAAVDL
jgi:hypothetical protein